MNLACVALRAVCGALENDEEAARAALVALLAPSDASGNRARSVAPVVQRDPKPEKIPRPAARRRVARPARPAPAASDVDGEGAQLARALVERTGSIRAAAKALGSSRLMVRRWAAGASCSESTVARLRAALGESEDGAAPSSLSEAPTTPGDEQAAEEPKARTEAQGLVAELMARYGDLERVARSTGLGLDHLRAWDAGRPCSPRALARLRDAAHAPRGRQDARRPGATPAAAPKAAAGEGAEDTAA